MAEMFFAIVALTNESQWLRHYSKRH